VGQPLGAGLLGDAAGVVGVADDDTAGPDGDDASEP
jgi:hypothetical protein